MFKLFTKHPESIGETYWQHLKCATYYGISMIYAGTCCLIHAIMPFMFQTTASSINKKLYQDIEKRNDCKKIKCDC